MSKPKSHPSRYLQDWDEKQVEYCRANNIARLYFSNDAVMDILASFQSADLDLPDHRKVAEILTKDAMEWAREQGRPCELIGEMEPHRDGRYYADLKFTNLEDAALCRLFCTN
jgi:hypothetical protein